MSIYTRYTAAKKNACTTKWWQLHTCVSGLWLCVHLQPSQWPSAPANSQ